MKKRHIVLGGAGFIGSHLCDALLARGESVVVYDNMTTGRVSNLQHISCKESDQFRDKQLMIIVGDVQDFSQLEWAASSNRYFDFVWNLACPASPPAYQLDPIATMMTCVLGAKHALDLACLCGPKTVVIQASTSEVYGDPLEHPQHENYRGNVNSIGPRACYDEGKRAAEALCYDYMRMHRVDVRVARIFNTYGPRMREDDGRVVSNFITQSLRGKRLTIHGTGEQTRSFCYVSDLVDGLLALSDSQHSIFEPINLGNPCECTLATLATDILRLTGRHQQPLEANDINSLIQFKTLPVDDPCRRKPDITRAQTVLGWNPKIDRHDGLAKTIDYFRKTLTK